MTDERRRQLEAIYAERGCIPFDPSYIGEFTAYDLSGLPFCGAIYDSSRVQEAEIVSEDSQVLGSPAVLDVSRTRRSDSQVGPVEDGGEMILTDPGIYGGGTSGGGLLNTVFAAIGPIVGAFTDEQLPSPGEVAIGIGSQRDQFPNPTYEATTGPSCWQSTDNPRTALMRKARRSVRVMRQPDPSAPGGYRLVFVSTCKPRRMNPLNPKALARAGRRVGSFMAIAEHMGKMLQKACRTKARKVSRPYYSKSCKTRCR